MEVERAMDTSCLTNGDASSQNTPSHHGDASSQNTPSHHGDANSQNTPSYHGDASSQNTPSNRDDASSQNTHSNHGDASSQNTSSHRGDAITKIPNQKDEHGTNNIDSKPESTEIESNILDKYSALLNKAKHDEGAFEAMQQLRRYLSEPLGKVDVGLIALCTIEPSTMNETYLKRIDECIEKDILKIIKHAIDPYFCTSKGDDISDTQVCLLEEAFWFLTNIASGTRAHTERVITEGFVPYALRIASANIDITLTAQCFMFLTNVIDDCPHRVTVTDDFLHRALDLIQTESSRMRHRTECEHCKQAVENQIHGLHLCYTILKMNSSAVSDAMLRKMMLVCCGLLQDECLSIRVELLHILFKSSSDRITVFIELMLEFGYIPSIITQLKHENSAVRVQAIKVTGNLLLGCDAMTWPTIRSQLLTHLPALFIQDSESVQQTLWLLSNVVAGPSDMLVCMFEFYFIPYLPFWLSSAELKTVYECLWVVGNLLDNTNKEQRDRLLEFDKYDIVSSMVKRFSKDLKCMENSNMAFSIGAESLLQVIRYVKSHFEEGEEERELEDITLTLTDKLYRVVQVLRNEEFVKCVSELADDTVETKILDLNSQLEEISEINLKE